MSEDDRARLARLMNERRMALGLRWSDVADLGGTSPETLRAVRRESAPLRDLTKAAIARGLRWTMDSVDRVLSGDDPIPLQDGAPSGAPDIVRQHWDLETVRRVWGDDFLSERQRTDMVGVYLVAVEARRRQKDAEVTELRRANGGGAA